MSEEIDIIELLKRVKEGIAPKKIEIEGNIFYLDEDEATSYQNIDTLYSYHNNRGNFYWTDIDLYLNTKIKILDKSILEELGYELDLSVNGLIKPTEYEKRLGNCIIANAKKINEIIRYLNKEEK